MTNIIIKRTQNGITSSYVEHETDGELWEELLEECKGVTPTTEYAIYNGRYQECEVYRI